MGVDGVFASVKWLAAKIVSEMTCTVSSGKLNPPVTHLIIILPFCQLINLFGLRSKKNRKQRKCIVYC